MRRAIMFSAIVFLCGKVAAQNVGIGQPSPQQKLDVNGAVKIGTTTNNQAGTIRYNSGVFEGGDGTSWKPLQGLPAGTIVLSETTPNPILENYGFTYYGCYPDSGTIRTPIPSVSMDSWLSTTQISPLAPNLVEINAPFLCWTGSEVLFYAGPVLGRKYNQVTDTWTAISQTGAPPFSFSTYSVWTGTEMLVYDASVAVGAKYNPVTDIWTAMSSVGGPNAERILGSVVWTGTEMIIWGGHSTFPTVYYNTGYRYNPSTNTWTPTSNSSAPSARGEHTAVWAGNRMIIWGGEGSTEFQTGMKYNPTTDNWTMATSLVGAPSARRRHTAVWTGTEMIVYGGSHPDQGGKYNSAADTWSPVSNPPTSGTHVDHSAIWTGTRMIIWGGTFGFPVFLNTGQSYDPVTNSWTTLSTVGAPEARTNHSSLWTGSQMIIWGGNKSPSPITSTGGRYFPSANAGFNGMVDQKSKMYFFKKN